MSKVSEVTAALSGIGCPVKYQYYLGTEPDFYATFFFYDETGALSNDDVEQLTNYYLQVDIWSKPVSNKYTSYEPTEKLIKSVLGPIGYDRTGAYDLPDPATKIMHRAVRFKKIDVPDL
jgi:hypothetical protein